MSPPPIRVDITEIGDGVSLARVVGRLDSATVPTVEEALQAPIRHGRGVVYHLADLHYISAAGVRLIVAAVRLGQKSGVRVAFACIPHEVAETLSVSGFAMFLSTFESTDEAVAHVRGGPV